MTGEGMRFLTRDFGEIEIETDQVISFRQPIFGFDSLQLYTMLRDPEAGEDIVWLQSLESPELCFILVSARVLNGVYIPTLPNGTERLIGDGEYECWLIAVIKDDFTKSTINLKSPVLINWKTGLGAQVILDGDYPIRHPLMGEAEDTC